MAGVLLIRLVMGSTSFLERRGFRGVKAANYEEVNVCVCVCASCECKRGREEERKRGKKKKETDELDDL